MSQSLTLPLLGLESEFPDLLYVLHHVTSDRYACFIHDGIHGLASFSSESAASAFRQLINLEGMVTREVSFDEAREVAKGRPLPVTSLMLLDRIESPEIHFVR